MDLVARGSDPDPRHLRPDLRLGTPICLDIGICRKKTFFYQPSPSPEIGQVSQKFEKNDVGISLKFCMIITDALVPQGVCQRSVPLSAASRAAPASRRPPGSLAPTMSSSHGPMLSPEPESENPEIFEKS